MQGRDDVGFLEFVRERWEDLTEDEQASIREAIQLLLGVDVLESPLDIPLHDLDWQTYRIMEEASGDETALHGVRVQTAVVYRDDQGRFGLARPGDLLLHSESGHYALLRRLWES